MNLSRPDDDTEESTEDGGDPLFPEGVPRGIEDIDEGDTASKEDLESVLKF
jgi:hypothetical protein